MGARPTLRAQSRVSTALCCTLATLIAISPTPANAADECGAVPPAGGLIECPQGDYGAGIGYDAALEDLAIVVDPGSTLEGGLSIQGGALAAILNGVDVSTVEDNDAAVSLNSITGADLIIAVQDLTTAGAGADGIYAHTSLGGISIANGIKGQSGLITTSGDGSAGIHAEAGGSIAISSDSIRTYGVASNGIEATSTNGPVDISSTSISVADGVGIKAQSAQDLTIVSGNVSAGGNYDGGIEAISHHDISITSGDVTVDGQHGAGLFAVAGVGSVYIHANDVAASGDYNRGIEVFAGDDATIVAHDLTTTGALYGGDGIFANASNVSITANDVSSYGRNSVGIYAQGDRSVSIKAHDISATRAFTSEYFHYAYGIVALGNVGPISIDVHDVYAQGNGILAYDRHGDISINANSVTTGYSYYYGGILAFSPHGNVSIDVNHVSTYGLDIFGIIGAATSGNVEITFGDVEVNGDFSVAVHALGGGDLIVDGDSIYTNGALTFGAYLRSFGGSGSVNVDSITTAGLASAGLIIQASTSYNYAAHAVAYGPVRADIGSIVTSGDGSPAALGLTNGGDLDLAIGSIETSGYRSEGILLRSTTLYDYGLRRPTNVGVQVGSIETDGDFATGIDGYLQLGTANLDVGSITTHGNYASGIVLSSGVVLFGGEAPPQNFDINVDNIATYGKASNGIVTYGNRGSVDVRSEAITTNGPSSSGIVVLGLGQITIDSASVVLNDAAPSADEYSTGIFAQSFGGGITIRSSNVSTEGNNSSGIFAGAYARVDYYGDTQVGDLAIDAAKVSTEGKSSVGISATGAGGNVEVHAGDVRTAGDNSTGIVATSFAFVGGDGANPQRLQGGDLDLSAANVVTQGDHSPAIVIQQFSGGGVQADAGIVSTAGDYSDGLLVLNGSALNSQTGRSYVGNLDIAVGSSTTGGDHADAVFLYSNGGDVQLGIGSAVAHGAHSNAIEAINAGAGALDIEVSQEAHSDQSIAILASSYGDLTLGVDEAAHVYGGTAAVMIGNYGDGKVTIVNHGEIAGPISIDAVGKGVSIENSGTVRGPVELGDGADSFDNSGSWLVFGNSNFGGGADILSNSGQLLADAGTATGTVFINDLERLDNGALISLADGHPGQTLNLESASFAGTTGSTLALDIGNSNGSLVADKLILGAATGSTKIVVNGTPAFGSAVVVDASSSSGSGNFVLANGKPIDFGFIRLSLGYDAAGSNWSLSGSPDTEVFETSRIEGSAQSLWKRGADAWTQMVRDNADVQRNGFNLWGHYLGGHERIASHGSFDVLESSFNPDLATDSNWSGFQVGADLTRGRWTWGIVGGSLEERTKFIADGNRLKLRGTDLGAYAAYRTGRFFFDGLLNYQRIGGSVAFSSAGFNHDVRGSVFGVHADAGVAVPLGSLLAQPEIGVSWSSASLDDFAAAGAALDFKRARNLEVNVGGRLTGSVRTGSVTMHPYAGLYVVDDLAGENALDFALGGQSVRLKDQSRRGYAEGAAGLMLDVGAFRLSVGGQADFLGGHDAWKGEVGLSWRG